MENESEWDKSLNFFMLVHLVMETGAFVLRNLLKKEAPTNSLQCRIHTLLNHPNYKNVRKILNPVQLKLIQGQQPDPEKFDISLTMILLRSICPNIKSPSQGWHGTPNPNDTSLEDDLKRLQDIRNSELLLHSPTTLMTYCTFIKYWEETTNLIRRLAKSVSNQVADAVETQIQETEQKQFDLSPANKLRLLRILEDNIVTSLHFKQESEDIKRSLKEMLKADRASGVCFNNPFESVRTINLRVSPSVPVRTIYSRVSHSDVELVEEEVGEGEGAEPSDSGVDVQSNNTRIRQQCLQSEQQGEIDYETLYSHCVTVIKMYPWLKSELERSFTQKLTHEILKPDDAQSVMVCRHRRSATDKLLKYVLKSKTIYLRPFLRMLKDESDSKEELKEELNRNKKVTEKEIQDYKRLNEQEESVPLPQGPVSSPWRLQDNDKKEIGFQIKDIVSIDSLNDCFLSKFFYSLMEHDEVCDCLHRDDLGSGVLKLFATMETCPMEIMHCFCDTLDMIGKERIVTQWKLRDKYHCSEIKQPEEFSFETQMVMRMLRWCGDTIVNFYLHSVEFGSIWLYLKPGEENAWGHLKEKCDLANVADMLDRVMITEDEMVRFFTDDGHNLQLSVFKEVTPTRTDPAAASLVLKYDLVKERSQNQEDVEDHTDPIAKNMDLLCEELEITDDLIGKLTKEALVNNDIVKRMKQTKTRAGRIKYLLTHIKTPKKGYEIIKQHQRSENPFLYHELSRKDERKLLFQCEAKLETTGDVQASDFKEAKYTWKLISHSGFFDSEDIPKPLDNMEVNVDCPDTATKAKYTDLSKKLYQVMEDIGVTVKVRNASVRLQRRIEVLQMLLRQPVSSLYIYGSQYEGVNTQSMISDINCVRVLDCPDIVTNLDNAVGTNCLYVINDDIRAGFVELQLVRNGKPLTKEDTSWLTGHTTLRGGFDDENRLVCFPKLTGSHEHEWTGPVSGFWKTKSSLSMKYGLECTIWPVCAATWVSRERKYNWPSQEMVENCKSLGCLIVPPEQDGMQKAYLWEVLFALQERLLITEFNSTQMKCFTLMRLMKAELLSNGNGSEILTSYHCKTCIFYTIENTPSDFWKPKNLVSCLIACWKVFLCWIERAYCPNYFVPARNMFNGLPTEEMRKRGEQIQMILADLNAALARLGTDEIGDRLLQYNNTEPISTEEQRKLTRLYEFRCALPIISMVCCARNSVLNDEFNNKKNVIFENLLKKMQQLTEMQIVKGHTEEETKDVLSLLTKMVQPTLLANCVARKHELGDTPRQTLSSIKSCDYETEKTFNTRNLKKAVMQFEFLDYAGSESLLRPMRWSEKVSICGCKARRSAVPEPEDIDKVTDWMFDVSSEDAMFDVLTPCVVFLPSEIAVTPLPIMYETLRSFGMPPGTRNDQEDYWYDWAVVDGQFLVQFMMWYNEADQGKCWQFGVNLNKMLKVINTGNVSHLETCYNLLGWMCFNEYGLVGLALEFYLRSLSIKPTHNAVYWHLCFLLLKLSQNVILESESD